VRPFLSISIPDFVIPFVKGKALYKARANSITRSCPSRSSSRGTRFVSCGASGEPHDAPLLRHIILPQWTCRVSIDGNRCVSRAYVRRGRRSDRQSPSPSRPYFRCRVRVHPPDDAASSLKIRHLARLCTRRSIRTVHTTRQVSGDPVTCRGSRSDRAARTRSGSRIDRESSPEADAILRETAASRMPRRRSSSSSSSGRTVGWMVLRQTVRRYCATATKIYPAKRSLPRRAALCEAAQAPSHLHARTDRKLARARASARLDTGGAKTTRRIVKLLITRARDRFDAVFLEIRRIARCRSSPHNRLINGSNLELSLLKFLDGEIRHYFRDERTRESIERREITGCLFVFLHPEMRKADL